MIKDIFAYPMRILFLCSAFSAVVAGLIFFAPIDFVSLHKFIFLHLVTALAYGGFLMTGLTDWTNFARPLKAHSYVFFGCFVLAFLSMFFSLWLAHIFMAIFWAYLVCISIYMVWLDKNTDQLGVLSFLLAIFCFQVCYLFSEQERFLNLQIHLHVIAVLLVSFRISVVLGREALNREKNLENAVFVPNFVYKNLAIVCVSAFLIVQILFEGSKATDYAAIACGSAILAKLKEWHYRELMRYIFVAFYYAMQLFIALGYIAYGVSGLAGAGLETNFLHIIAINGVMFAIMLVFNIAGLRHSGQELVFLRLSKAAFLLVMTAGVLRGVFANFGEIYYIWLPAILFIVAFSFWTIDFYVIFRDNDFSDDPE